MGLRGDYYRIRARMAKTAPGLIEAVAKKTAKVEPKVEPQVDSGVEKDLAEGYDIPTPKKSKAKKPVDFSESTE